MERFTDYIGRISKAAGYTAGILCLITGILVLAEITARTALGFSLLLTLELSEWALVAIVFLGSSWALKDGGHIRVNLLTDRLPPRAQLMLEIAMSGIGVAFVAWLLFHSISATSAIYAGKAEGYSPRYHMLLWRAWVPLVAGLALLALQFAGLLLKKIIAVRRVTNGRSIWSLGVPLLCSLFVGLVVWNEPFEFAGLSWTTVFFVSLGLIFTFIIGGFWIFLSLMLVGVFMLSAFTTYPAHHAIPQIMFNATSNFILVAVPLFILMGNFLYHSQATNTLYTGVSSWVEGIPGGLLHSNVVACSFFAAISGSSAATCATIGSVAIPELKRRGYDRGIAIGSLAGAGTLGLMIPPSIMAIVYGALTATSIGQLFIAGVIPGLMIAGFFMTYIAIAAIRNPKLAPVRQRYSWRQRGWGIVQILPISGVILLVLGGIYGGFTTPTEAAAIGAACSVALAGFYRKLNMQLLRDVLLSTVRTSAMCLCILVAASILSSAAAYLLIPQELAKTVVGLGLPKYAVFALLCLIYIFLGCFFEGITMMVLTLPILFPVVVGLGFDPVWFGVILIVLIEIAQITPPIGINLFVLQNITGEPIERVAKQALPFFLCMLLALLVLALFPQIALWLPAMM
ncbi:TRAP transporter large permease subunit [Chloroflexota bacterium]